MKKNYIEDKKMYIAHLIDQKNKIIETNIYDNLNTAKQIKPEEPPGYWDEPRARTPEEKEARKKMKQELEQIELQNTKVAAATNGKNPFTKTPTPTTPRFHCFNCGWESNSKQSKNWTTCPNCDQNPAPKDE